MNFICMCLYCVCVSPVVAATDVGNIRIAFDKELATNQSLRLAKPMYERAYAGDGVALKAVRSPCPLHPCDCPIAAISSVVFAACSHNIRNTACVRLAASTPVLFFVAQLP